MRICLVNLICASCFVSGERIEVCFRQICCALKEGFSSLSGLQEKKRMAHACRLRESAQSKRMGRGRAFFEPKFGWLRFLFCWGKGELQVIVVVVVARQYFRFAIKKQ